MKYCYSLLTSTAAAASSVKSIGIGCIAFSLGLLASNAATSIPVVNGGFEDAPITWNYLPTPTSTNWIWDGAGSEYSVLNQDGSGHFDAVDTDESILHLENAISTSSSIPKSIYQNLTYTVAAGDVFTLAFDMGQSTNGDGTGSLLAQIWVGDTLVATRYFNPTAPVGFWEHATLTGTAASTGQLKILFGEGTGSEPWLDNVTMNVIPVGSEVSPLAITITPNAVTPSNYDFSWNSQEGKIYDLVSATDLSSPPATWLPWDNRTGIVATPSTNILLDVPGGGDTKRFFILVEKDQ